MRPGPAKPTCLSGAFTIPRSEFLDQAHIRTICTRVQFAANACPKGAVYGHVKAFSPIVDYPVQGPVYLRSSDHNLPDLVFDLRGPVYQPVHVVVALRIDSHKGQIRVTAEGVPDLPVSKLIFTQQGGKKGLLVNSQRHLRQGLPGEHRNRRAQRQDVGVQAGDVEQQVRQGEAEAAQRPPAQAWRSAMSCRRLNWPHLCPGATASGDTHSPLHRHALADAARPEASVSFGVCLEAFDYHWS